MGYRSEWCLKVAGPEKDVESFVDELTRIAASGKEGEEWYSRADCANTIFACRLPNRHWPDKNGKDILAIWHDTSTKCYGKWDTIIRELIDFAETLGLKAAYGRLGDDMDDSEFINDSELSVLYRRELVLDDAGEPMEPERCEHGMFHTGVGACPKCEGS